MTAPPPVDMALLQTVTDGDEALAAEILDLFMATARNALAELSRHPPGSPGWVLAAHTLKGSAGNLGAQALVEIAAQAERARDAGAAAGLRASLAAAVGAVEAFIAAVRAAPR